MESLCRWILEHNPLEHRHLFIQVGGGAEDVAGGISTDAEPTHDR